MPRPILLTLLICFSIAAPADELWISDRDGNDIAIQRLAAEGDLLAIWFVDHEEPRPVFDQMLERLSHAGIEVWRVDLLAAYFLPRSSETQRTLDGTGVAAVLHEAHRRSDKRILLAAYDRMPLPLLRGIHLWQQERGEERLAGAMLFYPNLFGPAPLAGEEPQIDPVLESTNIPLVIYQPALGSQRWRLAQVIQPLWRGGSPAYVYLVPGVRDWFFMGEGEHGPQEQAVIDALPGQMLRFAELLEKHPVAAPKASSDKQLEKGEIRTLVELSPPRPLTPFELPEMSGGRFSSQAFQGQVVLLNFWATWCPPCVEELPSLNRLQQRYRGEALRIVSIDFRETPEEMEKFLQRTPVEFPVLMDGSGKVSLEWRVFSFPSSFIIDRRGRIRYSANRAIDWDSPEVWRAVERLLDEKS